MRVRLIIIVVSVFMIMMLSSVSFAEQGAKRAIMLTVFGTSTEASVTFDELVPMVEKKYPGWDVYVPYTSKVIRNKLNKDIDSDNDKILSPDEMLKKLKEAGYTEIAVPTTIIFDGVEHGKLKDSVDSFAKINKDISIKYIPPILADRENIVPVVKTLAKYIDKDAMNIVVAHGSHDGHPVEKTYLRVADSVRNEFGNTYMASIEGIPSMVDIMKIVEDSNMDKVRFIVFMFVAGDHAQNDIVGDDEDSLYSISKEFNKTPSVVYVETTQGRGIASLGLDSEYRALLLHHIDRHMPKR